MRWCLSPPPLYPRIPAEPQLMAAIMIAKTVADIAMVVPPQANQQEVRAATYTIPTAPRPVPRAQRPFDGVSPDMVRISIEITMGSDARDELHSCHPRS